MLIAGLAVLAALFSSGAVGKGEQSRWKGSAILAGLGLALMMIPMAFILSIVRVGTGSTTLGAIGAFMTFLGGFVIFASGRGVVSEFHRRKIYSDVAHLEAERIAAEVAAAAELGLGDADREIAGAMG